MNQDAKMRRKDVELTHETAGKERTIAQDTSGFFADKGSCTKVRHSLPAEEIEKELR
jgi:hypothetical protein